MTVSFPTAMTQVYVWFSFNILMVCVVSYWDTNKWSAWPQVTHFIECEIRSNTLLYDRCNQGTETDDDDTLNLSASRGSSTKLILLVKYQVFCCPICPDILRWRWPPAYACNREDTDCFSLRKYIIALLKAATWEDFTRYIIALLTAAIWTDLRRLTTALLKAAVYYCATESSNQLHFATESDHTNELHSLHILEFTGSRYDLLYEKHFSDWLANLALML